MSDFVELMKRGGNEALKLNPPYGVDFHITKGGSDWLFAACSIFGSLALLLIIVMFRRPVNERMFFYTAIAPCAVMSVAYFTMGSNLGWAITQAIYNRHRVSTQTTHMGFRQVFYARYVGWFLALPWVVIQASIFGKTPVWHIFFNVLMTEFYVVSFLIGILVHSQYRWGYYTFGCICMFIACISVMTTTRNIAKRKGGELYTCFTYYFGICMFFWFIYPLIWGLCEGGNVLNNDAEQIWYGIMDVLLMGCMPVLFVPVACYLGQDKLGYHFEDIEAELEKLESSMPPKKSSTKSLGKKKKSKK
ncbi:Mrh1p KNAG_0H01270 [Huiozyma naganishii CBS 8797]|uniref:Uncharacterized protein n=1 Tax=Huiozyma naganishii (strain ATCC MYA-139 / BCRC 22969 / CBS 8797 / KCTC 17520 / NBRC 10181 / NCYC 3082 / Yp74L-3) TaxID=1071383 RepID=J7R9K8_HUIN7|nr:hypothetical protein KNAG_0H01270 [Kazachstania naganishii CBS 8797]CCK71540.1 hypothetical protein KNAG_0H01270 [Kazachstania naganishii CBS 8797]